MRAIAFAAMLVLTGCVAGGGGGNVVSLRPSDPATSILVGGPLSMRTVTSNANGDDPLVVVTLSRADGRSMQFEEANHAPNDVRAQAVSGPLAQAMGLMGEEQPVLYHLREGGSGAPFICAPGGPLSIGIYSAPDGQVSVVGLKSNFEFEERPDGTAEALPYSPDHICARMHFTKG